MTGTGQLKKKAGPYGYLIPSAIIFGIFLFYPFVKTIYLSLYKTNKLGQAKLFVGFGNYKDLLTSASFANSLSVTAVFVVIVVIGGMLLGLIGAVLCNKTISGHTVLLNSICASDVHCIELGSSDLPDYA